MRAILSLAHCHGDLLGTAWYMVLNTLQQLTMVLGLTFSSAGETKAFQVKELPTLVSFANLSALLTSRLQLLSERVYY